MKSKRSALAAGINTSLWIASADTSRLWFPPGISERNPPARLREGVVVSGVSAPPRPARGAGAAALPHTLHTPHVAGPHMPRRRAGTAHTRGHAGTHTPGHAHAGTHTYSAFARGTGKKSIPFPRAAARRPSTGGRVLAGCPARGGGRGAKGGRRGTARGSPSRGCPVPPGAAAC